MNEEKTTFRVRIPKLSDSVQKDCCKGPQASSLGLLAAPLPTPHPPGAGSYPLTLGARAEPRGRDLGNFKLPLPGKGWRYETRELQSPASPLTRRGPPTALMGKLRPREPGSHSAAQRLRLFWHPWPHPRAPWDSALGSRQGRWRGPQLSRSRTRPAHAYLTALLLYFPRRAHIARLKQMLVDERKQLPSLPGLSHAHDLRPAGSPARPPQPPPATSLVPLDLARPTSGSSFARTARHAGKCSLISWSGPVPCG